MTTWTPHYAMASKILPFPAKTCFFFIHGRCSLPQTSLRAREDGPQCRVLSIWERLQDEAMDKAEKNRLNTDLTLELVARTLEQAQDLALLCPGYRPGGKNSALDCIFLHGHLCIQSLPICAGICRHFQPRKH
ncbi:MAG TPA: hypothetical protein ENN39_13125 [Desulfonatronum sp.]|nr:hypothetical protein [Desulfonatronum sp.]